RQATSTGGASPKAASGNLPQAEKHRKNERTGRAKDKAAAAVGMSRHTYERAKEVVQAADTDLSLKPIVDEMDATGKVAPAHQKITSALNGIAEPALKDSEGHSVPPACAEAFTNRAKFKAIDCLARQMQVAIDELSRLPGGEHLRRFLQATGNDGSTV